MDEQGCIPIQLYLWTKLNSIYNSFHVSQNSVFLSIFFQPFKNVKRVLSSQAAQKTGNRSDLAQGGP